MAKYNKIFWLEDNPDFLENYFRNCEHVGLKRDDLLARIVWAYDFNEGASIVRNSNFDLYILDADFPDVCTPEHRENVNACLEMIKDNRWEYCRFKRHNDDAQMNNFIKFYQQFLIKSKNKVVVHSMSTLAPIFAFALGLPFYCKGGLNEEECKNDEKLWREHIEMEAKNTDNEIDALFEKVQIDRRKLNLQSLDTYECGAVIHFIKNYLLY